MGRNRKGFIFNEINSKIDRFVPNESTRVVS